MLPILGLCIALFLSMAAFALRCRWAGRPRTPYIEGRAVPAIWKWWMEWWIWLWGPVERTCVRFGIPPNAITLTSTMLTGVAGLLLGTGRLTAGGWLYLFASSLDLVDGRVARAQGSATKAGAFLDSTLDRVAELFAFAGLAVYFRNEPALYAVLGAAGASLMVSYTRARGESLGTGTEARVGGMQRAERVVLTGLPCALSPVFAAAWGPAVPDLVIAGALAILAGVTTVTALRRGHAIWAGLRAQPEGRAVVPPLTNVRWLDAARHRERFGR
jgi:phosphatidylglycerophosphate synthase